jgi:pimeloyl-ACP methyl ester carboxylesterase
MQLPTAVQPAVTIAQILTWLTDVSSEMTVLKIPAPTREAIVAHDPAMLSVRETAMELGRREMFGVVSEPVGESRGPLMVMVNGFNEDHLGPARLWVELSRRWAGLGLRCVRFDLSELGESPWMPDQPDRDLFDKSRSHDIADALAALNPANPGNAVLIGYCSGAQLALKVALELNVQGVCAMNPEIGARVFRNVDRLRQSDHDSAQLLVRRVEHLLRRHRTVDRAIRKMSHLALSFAYPPKVPAALMRNHTETLLLLSPEDLSPLLESPIIGPILRRRLISSEHLRVEVVPGMDHAILSTIGRERAVAILDRHVIDTFLPAVPSPEPDRTAVNRH